MNARLVKVTWGIPRGGATYFERVVRCTELADPDPQAVVVDLFLEAEIAWISCLEMLRLPV